MQTEQKYKQDNIISCPFPLPSSDHWNDGMIV